MKYIKIFNTKTELLSAKDKLVKPYLCLAKDTNTLFYSHKGEGLEEDTIQVIYKTNMVDYHEEVDYLDFFYYDGTYDMNGTTYYKWRYTSAQRWVLTDTKDFSNISLSNPYEPSGYIWNDEFVEGDYGTGDLIVEGGTLTFVKRDISTVNANSHSFVDLGLPSGTLWATCNVGASSPTEYGKYFQWGDTEGYYDNEAHTFNWSTYKYGSNYNALTKYNTKADYGTVDNKIVLDLSDDAVHANMGGDWKMPTKEQLSELVGFTEHEWVTDYQGSGVNGRLFKSKKDSSKSIFIPAAGDRWGDSFRYEGLLACLWSSSLYGEYPYHAWFLYFSSDEVRLNYDDRYYGYSVRGVL